MDEVDPWEVYLTLEVDGKVSLSGENIVTGDAVNTHKVGSAFITRSDGRRRDTVSDESKYNVSSLSLYQEEILEICINELENGWG